MLPAVALQAWHGRIPAAPAVPTRPPHGYDGGLISRLQQQAIGSTYEEWRGMVRRFEGLTRRFILRIKISVQSLGMALSRTALAHFHGNPHACLQGLHLYRIKDMLPGTPTTLSVDRTVDCAPNTSIGRSPIVGSTADDRESYASNGSTDRPRVRNAAFHIDRREAFLD